MNLLRGLGSSHRFVSASATSLVLSYQPGRHSLLHLVNATALLIAAALIGAVRVLLIVF